MKYLLFITGISLLSCNRIEQSVKPNVILIMADDLGYEGIGCYGNEIVKTPYLDSMAHSGLRFTDYHSNGSVCTPTRAALLTGMYQQRSGMEGVIYVKGPSRETGLDSSEYSIAKALRNNGYATGIMGKWHLGYQEEFNPVFHGFDEFYGFTSGNVDYHSHFDNAGIYDWWHNTDTILEMGYATDLIRDHSINFIRDHRSQPFLLYISHQAPHVPFQGRRDSAYRYPDREFTYYGPVTDTYRAYKEMVEIMDEGIGAIFKTLKDLELEEKTIVLFISDNGAETFGHNGNLKGSKGSLYEGGHRVPAIAYWKGKIAPGIIDQTIMSFDLMPTILSLTNSNIPLDHFFDGIDLSELLFRHIPLPERKLFWKYQNERAVRKGPYKLLVSGKDTSLFNLNIDLTESTNIASKNNWLTREMLAYLQVWEAEMENVHQKTR